MTLLLRRVTAGATVLSMHATDVTLNMILTLVCSLFSHMRSDVLYV